GAGRALARAGARRARVRRRGRPLAGRGLPPGLPGVAVLVRVPGVPRPRGADEAVHPARPRPDRCRAERGVPAAPGAVDVRDHRPPPRGEVLQCPLTGATRTGSPPSSSTWTVCWSTPSTAGRGPR